MSSALPHQRGRFAVVLGLFLLSMITYIDRVCISSAKEQVSSGLALSDTSMGLVFSAFALGYALAQIPSGWLADQAGPRLALSAVVAAWSLLTALTGAAWNLASLVAIRLLFGMAEAGAFPGSARAIANWLPTGERGRANGVLFSGSRLGAAFAFPLLAWMLTRWQWRTSFFFLGVLGMTWAAAWLLLFRDNPAAPAGQKAGPITPAVKLGAILRSRRMVLAMLQYFAGNFTFFICLSWMNPYLKQQYHLDNAQAAAYSMAPLLAGATSQWFAGWLVDSLFRSRLRVWSRRLPAICGFGLAAAGVLALSRAGTPLGAAVCFTLAAFGADMTISPSWVFCVDISGRSAGSVSGAMNMLGNFGSFISANAFPYMYSLTGSAAAYFVTAGSLNLLAIACWLGMRSVEPEGDQP